MHCISMLGSGCDVVQEEQVKSFWESTFIKFKKTNFLPFLSKGKHCAYSLNRISLYNIYIMLMIVHLSI
jgi:hypothetical protein